MRIPAFLSYCCFARMERFHFTVTMQTVFIVSILAVVVLTSLVHADGEYVQADIRYNATEGTFAIGVNDSFGPVAANVSTNLTFYVNGWDVVVAEGNEAFMSQSEENRLIGYRAAGYGEGFINYVRIYQNYVNSFVGPDGVNEMLLSSPQIKPWIERHMEYLHNRSLVSDDIGRQLGGLLALIEGLAEGYAAGNTDPTKVLNATQLFWLSFQAEVGDIITAYSTEDDIKVWTSLPQLDPRRPSRHCSALIRVLADDVYFAHDTWSSFNSMMRQYKTYRFEGRSVTMSGYPGVVHSIDDWYMTSNRLAVTETTNGVYNNSLFREYVRNGTNTISEFLRVMIANFLAPDAASWVTYFSTENSGTYNNQWMVFDMKQFTPGAALPSNTFWVAEQLPGSHYPYGVTAADKTDILNSEAYWASYNIPYFTNVFDVSGNLAQELQFGSFFSYTNYSRAEIFRRNYTDVVDVDSMKALMRYNNFMNDPLSIITNCKAATNGVCDPKYSAMLAIASRGDLNPPGGASKYGVNYQFLTRRNHCATDTKIALWSMMMNNSLTNTFTSVIINGPTTYQQPIFRWDTSPFANDATIIREGLPNEFNFPFMEFSVSVPAAIIPAASSNGSHGVAIGLGVAGGVVVVGVLIVLLVKSRKATSDASEQVNLVEDSI
jgi:hypothetical protein